MKIFNFVILIVALAGCGKIFNAAPLELQKNLLEVAEAKSFPKSQYPVLSGEDPSKSDAIRGIESNTGLVFFWKKRSDEALLRRDAVQVMEFGKLKKKLLSIGQKRKDLNAKIEKAAPEKAEELKKELNALNEPFMKSATEFQERVTGYSAESPEKKIDGAIPWVTDAPNFSLPIQVAFVSEKKIRVVIPGWRHLDPVSDNDTKSDDNLPTFSTEVQKDDEGNEIKPAIVAVKYEELGGRLSFGVLACASLKQVKCDRVWLYRFQLERAQSELPDQIAMSGNFERVLASKTEVRLRSGSIAFGFDPPDLYP